MFELVLEAIGTEFIPQIQRNAISGRSIIRVKLTDDNEAFTSSKSIYMAQDVLTERGFHVTLDCVTDGASIEYVFYISFPRTILRKEITAQAKQTS